MPFHIQLKLTMRLLQPIFYSILILLTTLSSCTTFKTVQNSGVLNTMAIELDDENVEYERLESKFNRRTFGGFLKGAENKNIVEATVIHNNNGSKTRATMNFFWSSWSSVDFPPYSFIRLLSRFSVRLVSKP